MRRALIVGIDHYPDSIGALTGCVNDAKKIQAALIRNEDKSPNFDCKVLTTLKEDITRSFLRQNIEELFSQDVDVALFYFSGHGTIRGLDGYLVTQDAKRYDEGISMSEVINIANRAMIREIVIMLDCCYSGMLGAIPAMDEKHAFLREGVSILSASGPSQAAVEVGGFGVFTSLVCDALDGGACDICGNVTVAGIYDYLDQCLGAWEQRPFLKSHVSKLISLRQCKPKIDISILRLITEYFSNPDEEFKLDPSYEPTALPRNERNERIFSNLQKFRALGLIMPVGEEHMYYAAINSKSCKLTPRGQFYWRVAKGGKL